MECQFIAKDSSVNWVFMYDQTHFPILDQQYPNSKFILKY